MSLSLFHSISMVSSAAHSWFARANLHVHNDIQFEACSSHHYAVKCLTCKCTHTIFFHLSFFTLTLSSKVIVSFSHFSRIFLPVIYAFLARCFFLRFAVLCIVSFWQSYFRLIFDTTFRIIYEMSRISSFSKRIHMKTLAYTLCINAKWNVTFVYNSTY